MADLYVKIQLYLYPTNFVQMCVVSPTNKLKKNQVNSYFVY